MTREPSIQYPAFTLKRAKRALRCCPFSLKLFAEMKSQSVPLPTIAGDSGIKCGYTQSSLSERQVETELGWLIQVGLLRREVDGQGITDSFRLTPLGRQSVDSWKEYEKGTLTVTGKEWLFNALNRWLRLPL